MRQALLQLAIAATLATALSQQGARAAKFHARIEAPPVVLQHISRQKGRTFVGKSGELKIFRNLSVAVVPEKDLDLKRKIDASTTAHIVLQLKPGRYQHGRSAFTTLPRQVLSGKLSSAQFTRKNPRAAKYGTLVFPHYLSADLQVRVFIRRVKQSPIELSWWLHGSVGLIKKPTSADHPRALTHVLQSVDSSVRRVICTNMLRVNSAQNKKTRQTAFDVILSNPFAFPVRGCLQFPKEDTYRVAKRLRGFHLASGEAKKMTFLIMPVDYGVSRATTKWWSRKTNGTYGRRRKFVMPRLELNYPADGKTVAELSRGLVKPVRPRPLLSNFKINKGIVAGSWRLEKSVLYAAKASRNRLSIPFEPPAEYDLRFSFTQKDSEQPIVVTAPRSPWPVVCELGGRKSLFHIRANRHVVAAKDYPKRHASAALTAGRHACVIKVRNRRLEVWLDGKRFLRFETKYRSLATAPQGSVRTSKHVHLDCFGATIFQQLEVVDVAARRRR